MNIVLRVQSLAGAPVVRHFGRFSSFIYLHDGFTVETSAEVARKIKLDLAGTQLRDQKF